MENHLGLVLKMISRRFERFSLRCHQHDESQMFHPVSLTMPGHAGRILDQCPLAALGVWFDSWFCWETLS